MPIRSGADKITEVYVGADRVFRAAATPPGPDLSNIFQVTYETTAPGETVYLYLGGCGAGNVIDWGDGHTGTLPGGGSAGNASPTPHPYAEPGLHQATYTGTFINIGSASQGAVQMHALRSVDRWGQGTLTTLASSAFRYAVGLRSVAVPPPTITDATAMFSYATTFNGDLSGWDTSSLTNVANMFNSAYAFNTDVSSWDTSSVTSMASMFASAAAFRGDVSGWDTSSVTSMASMFSAAYAFNADIAGWDTSSVQTMQSMFNLSPRFYRDLSGWDVAAVTNRTSFNTNANPIWVATPSMQPPWPS